MFKWLFSTIAFLLLVVSLTALTSSVFLGSAISNFNLAQSAFSNQSSALVDENFNVFISQMTAEQKQQFDQINSLSPAQRQQLLAPQCADPKNSNQPFCNQKFISGQITLDDAIKEGIAAQVDTTQFQALELMRDSLKKFKDYNLMLIFIVTGVLSILIYFATYGFLAGLQNCAGNAAWLSVFSAISFKTMPLVINNLLLVSKQPGATEQMMNILKSVASAWLIPSMDMAFIVSVWITIGAFAVWAVLKLLRNYDLEIAA